MGIHLMDLINDELTKEQDKVLKERKQQRENERIQLLLLNIAKQIYEISKILYAREY